jgi:tetratricopeptide (TPR) repeat protein
MPRIFGSRIPGAALAIAVLTVFATTSSAQSSDLDAKILRIFQAAYNLDQASATRDARALVAAAPLESRAHRALAGVLWLEILLKRGAVTVDSYLGGVARANLSLPKPPPALDGEFKRELATAISLAEKALDRNPDDVAARYDFGAAHALEAAYLASVEGRLTSALMSGKRAFDAAEEVLSRDPERVSAGTIAGTYRYLVSSLGFTKRMFAYVVGFGGDRELGIRLVKEAARDPRVRTEARTALLMIYSREGRHAEALQLLRELSADFPRNRIFVLEQGSAALRAGRFAEAHDVLTRGLSELDRDDRARMPGERALWLYKRAQARLRLARTADAAADLDQALKNDPLQWVRGRIVLEQGRVADVSGRRADALVQYRLARSISNAANDPLASAEAARLEREPFVVRRPQAGG